MNIEQIEQGLMKLFNKDKNVYEKRQIVFWYDEKWDFKEEIDMLSLKEVKIHKLNNNFFYTKYLLENEDTESNYLIYSINPKPKNEDNWLLDTLTTKEVYRLFPEANKSSLRVMLANMIKDSKIVYKSRWIYAVAISSN